MKIMLDRDDPIAGPEKRPGLDPRIGITWGFNAGLFAFEAAFGFLQFLASSARSGPPPIEGLILTTLIDSMRYGVVILLAAYFVGEFWDRFVRPVLEIRAIAYREAVAIVLIFGLLGIR